MCVGNWKYVMDEILINSCTFCEHIPTQFTRYLFRLHNKLVSDKKLDTTTLFMWCASQCFNENKRNFKTVKFTASGQVITITCDCDLLPF